MSKHTIEAELEVMITAYGIDPEKFYPTVKITFSFLEGYPDTGPSFSSAGEPGAADEIEALSVEVIKDEGIDMPPEWWLQRAQDWLNDDGYNAAGNVAHADNEPDPDLARDRMLEDQQSAWADDGGDEF